MALESFAFGGKASMSKICLNDGNVFFDLMNVSDGVRKLQISKVYQIYYKVPLIVCGRKKGLTWTSNFRRIFVYMMVWFILTKTRPLRVKRASIKQELCYYTLRCTFITI